MARILMAAAYEGRHCSPRCGCETRSRTRSAQRRREEKQWRTNDQEMPYYWRPTADIEEDYEEDPDPRHGPAGWAWRILQGEDEEGSD